MSAENETLMSCCASHGVQLDAAHVEAVEAIGDGSLAKYLFALVAKYGPAFAAVMPQVLAKLAAGDYLGALILIAGALSAIS